MLMKPGLTLIIRDIQLDISEWEIIFFPPNPMQHIRCWSKLSVTGQQHYERVSDISPDTLANKMRRLTLMKPAGGNNVFVLLLPIK